MMDKNTRDFMGEAKFYESYSRWNDELGRYETWEESVSRVMDMHRDYYKDKMTPELSRLIDEAEALYKLKYVLGAQRALQFGGNQLLKHHMRMFNCTSSYADRSEFFGEFFYVLLCGAGAGFSVQKHHVAKLPKIAQRKGQAKIHVVDDSIEGWSTSLDVLMSSFFVGGGKHPEYEGRRVYFDLTNIRPKGAMISGGFKAPGPEPLRKALDKIEHLLQGVVLSGRDFLKPIEVYDICMHTADAVLAGGVRRSATICLFSPDDEEMINAKTGNWFEENPQRARSNNSAVIVRSQADREQFKSIMKSIREFGEPGFIFTESTEHTFNPCVEIGMYPVWVDPETGEKHSGWQGCNLSEGNGAKCTSREEFLKVCRAASILGTLQAGYTDFKFLNPVSKKIFDREALIGVSITGWMNSPDVLLDGELLKEGARVVKEVNKEVAGLLGINPAARTTCVKPSGNACMDFDSKIRTSEGIMTLLDVFRYTTNNQFEIGSAFGGQVIHPSKDLFVYDENNNLKRVTGLYVNGYADTFEVEFVDGQVNIFTGNHKLKTSDGWKKVAQLTVGDKVVRFLSSDDQTPTELEIVRIENNEESVFTGDIEVEETHSYQLENGAVSHNSVILSTASGIHGDHAPRYLRNVQMNKNTEVAQLISETNPYMVEESVWSTNRSDYVISFPIIAPENSFFKKDLYGIKLLDKVKLVQQHWVEEGTNEDLCVDSTVRHNVSNTVQVPYDQWDEVSDYLFENRDYFAGVSLISTSGDKDYNQAPFIEVLTEQELIDKYGRAAFFASGLIVESFKGFGDLWTATFVAQQDNEQRGEQGDLGAEWTRKFKKFAKNYFNGDKKMAEYCLKDVYLLHKWTKIQQNLMPVDFKEGLKEKSFTDIDTMGAQACSGGACEI